ncbi:MAG: DUF4115 domain-containing protein [Chlorobi bacterium]|nr:DUF4115 domain-containing protein [Chlorobiota bacterium]
MEDDALHAGAILRQKRTGAGLTIADVSRISGIRPAILEAIEAGSFDVMPTVYMRSFVRRYARALGINERELPPIDSPAERHIRQQISPTPAQPRPQNRTHTLTIVVAVCIALAAVYALFLMPSGDSIPSQRTENNTESSAETIRTLPGGGLLDYFSSTSRDSIRLEAIAIDTVWISATIDGRRSEQVTLYPTDRRLWTANQAIVISIGNVGGVELYRNGIKLPPLGGRGEVVRYVKLTATDVIPSTTSWARKRDSVLETLRNQPPRPLPATAQTASPNHLPQTSPKNQTSSPRPLTTNERRRQEILQRAQQSREITPVPPKIPLPTPTKPSSP